MPKKIISVGSTFPHDDVEEVQLTSKQSLLDADIILFKPSIDSYGYEDTEYRGKPCLSDRNSHKWTEAISHWRREIDDAVRAEKLVIVMLGSPVSVFVATGEVNYTGSGRNRTTSRVVRELNSTDAIPLAVSLLRAKGTEMVLDAKARAFASLWEKFSSLVTYEAIIEKSSLEPLLWTKSGNRLVGGFAKKGRGTIVLMPAIDFDHPKFEYEEIEDGRKVTMWTNNAMQLGHELVAALTDLDSALKAETSQTPPPSWVHANEYRLEVERKLTAKIEEISASISKLEAERSCLEEELNESAQLRDLLFEQGSRLEAAVLKALVSFGFDAEKIDDGRGEFDAVFKCAEGRCIGEVEGRDNKDINITKFSQLERKIAEDFEREDVSIHAKGVLFGNPHRLAPLESRPTGFTEKCISAAARTCAALVRTADMFVPARYLSESSDADYARACRDAILQAKGEIVVFPIPPVINRNGGRVDRRES